MMEFRIVGEPDSDRRECIDCRHLKGAVTLWCMSDEAADRRGTRDPSARQCQEWEGMKPWRWWHFFAGYLKAKR